MTSSKAAIMERNCISDVIRPVEIAVISLPSQYNALYPEVLEFSKASGFLCVFGSILVAVVGANMLEQG